MSFKPDPSKQAQEDIFSSNIKVTALPELLFNNNPVHEVLSQKKSSLNVSQRPIEFFGIVWEYPTSDYK